MDFKRSYFICPRCLRYFFLTGDHEDGGSCSVCVKDPSVTLEKDWSSKIETQKMRSKPCPSLNNKGEACGGERLYFQNISICIACGKRSFYFGLLVGNSWIGRILGVFKNLTEIPPALFRLQEYGEVIIFQDTNPFNKSELYYFAWQIT